MKPIAVLIILASFTFHFVGAQTSPVYWELIESWQNNTWKNYRFTQYNYNNSGMMTLRHTKDWVESNANWNGGMGVIYAYNSCDSLIYTTNGSPDYTEYHRSQPCGNVDTILIYDSEQPGQPAFLSGQKFMSYTPEGRINSSKTYYWYFSNWVLFDASYYTYNTDGLITEINAHNDLEGGSSSVTHYYYTPPTTKPSAIAYTSNGAPHDSILYTYNTDGLETEEVRYIYNTDSTSRIPYSKVNSIYLSNGKLDTLKSYSWVDNAWLATEIRTYAYEYNTDSNLYRMTVNYFNVEQSSTSAGRYTYGYLPTAIEETASQNSITLFPNPAADVATLTFAQQPKKPVNISIYTTTGQLVLSYQAQGKQVELPVQGLSNGLYIVKTELEGTAQTVRLSIVR